MSSANNGNRLPSAGRGWYNSRRRPTFDSGRSSRNLLNQQSRNAPIGNRRPASLFNSSKTSGNSLFNSRSNDGPGGQVQIQRPRRQQQQLQTQQSKPATTKQQTTQEELDSVISMEAVMKDLQVLEQQQRDSQRKLQYAQKSKERSQQKHDEMESILGELKYVNGQSLSVHLRMAKILSGSHRELTTMRNGINNADGDLKDFSQDIQVADRAKHRATLFQRKVRGSIPRFIMKIKALQQYEVNTTQRVTGAEEQLDKAKNRHDILRDSLDREVQEQRKVAEEISKHNGFLAGLESDLHQKSKNETEITAKIEEAKTRMTTMANEHVDKTAKLALEVHEMQGAMESLRKTIEQEELSQKKNQEFLNNHRSKHIEMSHCHGVAANASVQGSVLFDEAASKKILETEDEVIHREEEALKNLEREMLEFDTELARLAAEEEACILAFEQQKAAIDKSQQVEIARKLENEEVYKNLEAAKVDVKDLRQQLEEAQKASNQAEADEKDAVKKLTEEIGELESAIRVADAEGIDLDGRLQKIEEDLINSLTLDGNQRQGIEKEIDCNNQSVQEIQKETKELQERLAHELSEVQIQEELTSIIDEHPLLERVVVNDTTDEAFEKQAEVDLRFVFEECAQRIESTKKEVQEVQDRQIAASLHDIEEESEKLCETEGQEFHMEDGLPIEESDEEQEPFKVEISAKKPKNLLATFQKVAVDESHVKKVRWSESSHPLSKKESVNPVDEAENMPSMMETIEESDPKDSKASVAKEKERSKSKGNRIVLNEQEGSGTKSSSSERSIPNKKLQKRSSEVDQKRQHASRRPTSNKESSVASLNEPTAERSQKRIKTFSRKRGAQAARRTRDRTETGGRGIVQEDSFLLSSGAAKSKSHKRHTSEKESRGELLPSVLEGTGLDPSSSDSEILNKSKSFELGKTKGQRSKAHAPKNASKKLSATTMISKDSTKSSKTNTKPNVSAATSSGRKLVKQSKTENDDLSKPSSKRTALEKSLNAKKSESTDGSRGRKQSTVTHKSKRSRPRVEPDIDTAQDSSTAKTHTKSSKSSTIAAIPMGGKKTKHTARGNQKKTSTVQVGAVKAGQNQKAGANKSVKDGNIRARQTSTAHATKKRRRQITPTETTTTNATKRRKGARKSVPSKSQRVSTLDDAPAFLS